MFRFPKAAFAALFAVFALLLTTQAASADRMEKDHIQIKKNYNLKKTVKHKSRVKKYHKKRHVAKTRKYRHANASIIAKVKHHARSAGVPVRVGLAVVKQESSFNPRARGLAGEIGLMQLKCSTARGMGYRGNCAGLYNVSTNLHYGMRYLKRALRRGSVGYYNAGIGAKKLPHKAKRYARSVHSKI